MSRIRVGLMACVDTVRRIWLWMRGFRVHTIDTPQGRVRFLETQGSGTLPPVLLVHGLSSAAVDWGPIMVRLRKHCMRVRAIDLPGHGLSDPPMDGMGEAAMRQMLMDAGADFLDHPQIVIGNSLGGMAAVRMANRSPEKILGLVLISPGGSPISQPDLDALLARFEMNNWAKAHAFVDAFTGGPKKRHLDLAWAVRARTARPSVQSLIARVSRDDLLSATELSTLTSPILLYWGMDDGILENAHLSFYRTHLPAQTELIQPEGMGHAPFLDDPNAFLVPVLDFCRRLPQRREG